MSTADPLSDAGPHISNVKRPLRLRGWHQLTALARYTLLAILFVNLAACASLPADIDTEPSSAFDAPRQTSLGRLSGSHADANPGKSGFAIVDTGRDALILRLAAIMTAERAIDLQYFIWNSDYSGRLMVDKLLQAADRGVRVRLLLDDFNVGDRDALLSVMAAHPNVEIRVFNPITTRRGVGQVFALLGEFDRLNQRMHNKSLIADASIAIVGGRNIGDEYFDLSTKLNFRDRDLLTLGPIVAEINDGFDAYWNSERSFPIQSFADGEFVAEDLESKRLLLEDKLQQEPVLSYPLPADSEHATALLYTWSNGLVWSEAEFLIDQVPRLEETDSDEPKQVARSLSALANNASQDLLIESAYLVLGDPALAMLEASRDRGVAIRALTNSLSSNDVLGNHAAYARRRPAMLKGGMALYELRPDAKSCGAIIGSAMACAEDSVFSLHSKSIVFDRQTVFVGSFNFNMRSVYLNSELGILVHSPELAEQIADDIEQNMRPENSWKVTLDDAGKLRWTDDSADESRQYTREPATGAWRRFKSGVISWFPIEKYL